MSQPTHCRANEYNIGHLLERYVGFAQDLLVVQGVTEAMRELALIEPKVHQIKGYLRMTPGYNLTENDDFQIRNHIIRVEGAGVPEVNGDYLFKDVMQNAGYYHRRGEYMGKTDVLFTMYKCSLSNGGFQWFISMTPEDCEPGTKNDTDFYWSTAKNEKLPPNMWQKLNSTHCQDPPPRISYIQTDDSGAVITGSASVAPVSAIPLMNVSTASPLSHGQSQFADSSDSDNNSGNMVGDGEDLNDDSFMSTDSHYRDFYE